MSSTSSIAAVPTPSLLGAFSMRAGRLTAPSRIEPPRHRVFHALGPRPDRIGFLESARP